MIRSVKKIYGAIRLNMGIKKWLERNLWWKLYVRLQRYFYKKIVFHYGADYRWNDQKSQNLDKKNFNFGYGLIHYALIRNQRPKRVLCVGSMYGYIPYMMAKACEDNGKGQVDFVDAGYDMQESDGTGEHNYGQGFWRNENAKDHFDYLLDRERVNLYVMTDKEFVQKYDYKYDYVYLDGDHRYKGAKRAFELFWPRLNEEGFICLHDIHFEAESKGVKFEQWKLWQDIIGDDEYEYKFELSNHYSGLGFVQKITKPRKRFKKKFD